MDFLHFKAGKDDDGRRLDKVIRKFLPDESLSSIYKAIRKGLIKIDGKKRDISFTVSENSTVSIAEFLLNSNKTEKNSTKESEKIEFESENATTRKFISEITVFKNEFLMILNKPYDMKVHPDLSRLSELAEKNAEKKTSLSFKTGPLHRLDRKTTGLIVFSVNLEGARTFSRWISEHSVKKTYLGLIEGDLKKEEKWIESLDDSADSKKNGFFTVKKGNSANSKISVTTAKPVSKGILDGRTVTLAEFSIETGRKHQIRFSAGENGHPLLGDTSYGGHKIKNFPGCFFLHAQKLEFPENNSLNLPQKIECEIPGEFRKILVSSGIKCP